MTRAPAELRLVADRAAKALAATGVPSAGDGVAVAVSGGADSLALLHALRALASPRGWRLAVVTVDHGLRPGSAADAAFVADHAKALGLPARVRTLAPADLSQHRQAGPEGAARAARYGALWPAADELGCRWLATGHTLDDQAETVLLQLLRGRPGRPGRHGVAAAVCLAPARRPPGRDPGLLHRHRPEWREDPTNAGDGPCATGPPTAAPLLEELRPGRPGPGPHRRPGRRRARLARPAGRRRPGRTGGGVQPGAPDPPGYPSRMGPRQLGVRVPHGSMRRPWPLPVALARRVVRAAARQAGGPVPDAAATDRSSASRRIDGAAGYSSRAEPIRSQAPVYEDDIESVLLTEDQVQTKVRDLAAQNYKDYAGRDVLLVGVLKGAFILMADLARHLTVPHEFDFMAVSSYGSATQTSGVVRILKDLDREIQGRDVLIIEDIIDSGLTLNYLLKNLRSRRPATLEVCALLYKPEQLKADIEVKYAGFDIPSVFVVGYGLDYAERYRNLPFVGTLKPEVYRGR